VRVSFGGGGPIRLIDLTWVILRDHRIGSGQDGVEIGLSART
jgi:hypothetical protein